LWQEVCHVKPGTASIEAMKQSPWGGMALVERPWMPATSVAGAVTNRSVSERALILIEQKVMPDGM